ncbi:MAG TPA: hypothetical protein VFA27_03295 [Vicinamibacterales bacterium]|nr:hypothetical protein [Vicinamibacterales bacterium]
MTLPSRVVMALLWIASLLVVGSIATAQTLQRQRSDPAPVISGEDLGFKPEGWQGKTRTGTWVVRINGEWVDAIAVNKMSPASTR